ncbi:MAG TPA: NUDIX domain-containing protein [Micromonosporaceae bacterium]|nr:NUDIX domain-containing protein [Micromonosporaceae bacterium]
MSVAWDESYQGQLRALAGDDRPLLFVGARCVVVDADDRILLIRRADNGDWALPAGAMELGESIGECAARELNEETGLVATSLEPFAFYSGARFTGVNMYGHTYQVFSTAFWIESWTGDLLRVTGETTDAAFYPLDRLPDGLARSVSETVDDFVEFRRGGRFVAK